MFIYFLTLLTLFLFSAVEMNISEFYRKKTVNYILLPIAWLLIVGQMSLRWDMATDWEPYNLFFERFADWDSYRTSPPIFEKGYWILNIICKSIVDNYTFFLFVVEATVATLLFRFLKFNTPNVMLCILMYYGLNLGMTGANRQLIAVVLCLSGLNCLINGNKLKFLGFVFLAYYFHASALLFLLFLFLNVTIPIPIVVTIIFICFVIGQTKLPLAAFSSFSGLSAHNAEKVTLYLKGAEKQLETTQVSTLGIIKKILLPTIFLLTRKKILEKHKNYNYLLNGYLFGTAFYFLFYKSLLIMISRGSLYFNILEPIILSFQVAFTQNNKIKNLILCLLAILSIVFMFQSIKAYPEIFIPYRSIFNKE